MEKAPLVVERIFNAPAERVWEAITDNSKMKQWYFQLEDFRPEVGFEFTFTGGTDDKQYVHLCRVTEVVTGKKLTYSWKYEGLPGQSFVTWELFPQGDKTRLVLTHKGLESFPSADDPNFAVESFAAGWNEIVGNSLKTFVESTVGKL